MSVVCDWCNDTGDRLVLNSTTKEKHKVWCHCKQDLPLKLVIQPEKGGCGIAAVATAAGKTYKEVRQTFRMDRDFTQEGMYDYELYALIEYHGFAMAVRYKNDQRLNVEREEWPPKPFAPLHIAQVRNLPDNGWHFVVVLADGRVLDPWWGLVVGLHRYPQVGYVLGLYKIPPFEAPKTTETAATEVEKQKYRARTRGKHKT